MVISFHTRISLFIVFIISFCRFLFPQSPLCHIYTPFLYVSVRYLSFFGLSTIR